MARSHGRIYCDIWKDDDFRALRPSAQRLYLFLVSQPNLSHLGVLPLTYRRWRNACDAYTSDDLREDLAELHEARFVVVDDDAEEVLVRALLRRDGVYKSPNVLRSAVSSASTIHSTQIKRTLLDEVDRIDLSDVSDEPGRNGQTPRQVVAALLADLRVDLAVPLTEPVENGSRNRSGNGSENPSENPDTRALPLPPSPTTIHTRTARTATPDGFAEFWSAYPKRVGKKGAEKSYLRAVRAGTSEADLLAGARRYAEQMAGVDPQYVAHPQTWLNNGRWDDEPPTPADHEDAEPWWMRRGGASA